MLRSGPGLSDFQLASAGVVGRFNSIEVDPDGNPFISYYDVTLRDLKLASRASGAWTIEVADSTGAVGEFSSLELGADGEPWIAYHAVDPGDLRLAHRVLGAWIVETVDSIGVSGRFASLVLGPEGKPHMSYLDDVLVDLKYSTWAEPVAAPVIDSGARGGAIPASLYDVRGRRVGDFSTSASGVYFLKPEASAHGPGKIIRVR